MNPVLFNLGPFEIRWYGLLIASAFFIGYFIMLRLARQSGVESKTGCGIVDTYFFYIFVGIIIGARLGEVLFYQPGYYLSEPLRILYIWKGGLSSHGAFIGGILSTMIFCRRHKIPFYGIADLVVIPIALGSVFVRIGNFINSEIVGRVTDLPWAVKFDNYEGLRHPSQIYEAVMNLTVFFILLGIRKIKKIPEGFVFWSFVLIYSLMRFFIEFFKEFQTLNASYYLTMGQWLSILFIVISMSVMVAKYWKFLGNIYKNKVKG